MTQLETFSKETALKDFNPLRCIFLPAPLFSDFFSYLPIALFVFFNANLAKFIFFKRSLKLTLKNKTYKIITRLDLPVFPLFGTFLFTKIFFFKFFYRTFLVQGRLKEETMRALCDTRKRKKKREIMEDNETRKQLT